MPCWADRAHVLWVASDLDFAQICPVQENMTIAMRGSQQAGDSPPENNTQQQTQQQQQQQQQQMAQQGNEKQQTGDKEKAVAGSSGQEKSPPEPHPQPVQVKTSFKNRHSFPADNF